LKVPWPGNRCVICLEADPLCKEHLIPQALGGRLTCEFLCSSCNSRLGHNLERAAKSDPSVLLAVKHLSKQIPSLARELLESHPHIGYSERGAAPGYVKNGEFRVRSQSLDDGTIIRPMDDAENAITTILRRAGYENSPIEKAVAALRKAPENKRVEVAPGLEIVNWRTDRVALDLSKTQMMNPLIPVKIAFEFLACHAGTTIYDEVPQLSEVRQDLYTMETVSDSIRVDRLSSNKYEPFHGICFEGNDPHAVVQVRLFGWLAFRVHFLKLSISGPRFIYTHRLDTGKEHAAILDKPRNQ